MIVRIPSPTDKDYDEILYNDYQELFQSANDWLAQNNSTKKITTISNYFEALQGEESLLRAYNDGKFLRIPLDEGLFDIDANSRKIIIPDEFNPDKGGAIGVQGDHLAEILFFKISRYFDEMDFDTCDCHIEWINARGDKMYSPAYAKQLVVNDEAGNDCSIIFGWIIDQNLMALAGEVKFAVRFVQHKDPKDVKSPITFNYLTSPATLKVLPCLPVEYNSLIESDYRLILSARPMYSGVVSHTGIKPVIVDYSWEGMPIVNLTDGKFTLYIEAKDLDSQDEENNSLIYRWYKNNVLQDNETDTFVATSNGEYYAMIGNEQETGTTWVQSQICNIPAAGPVTLALEAGTALKGYSNGENRIESVTAVANVADGNVGTLTYAWYDELSESQTPVGNAATLSIIEGASGDYYATVQHDLNNSPATTATMKDQDLVIVVRPRPVKPALDNLSVTFDDSRAMYVCAETSGMDDLEYHWSFYDIEADKEIDLNTGYTSANELSHEAIVALVGEPTADDQIKVKVRQNRFVNEPTLNQWSAPTDVYFNF